MVGTGIVLFSQRYIKKIKRVRRMILVVSVQNQVGFNLKMMQNITDGFLYVCVCAHVRPHAVYLCVDIL